jgi:hypothetical protein
MAATTHAFVCGFQPSPECQRSVSCPGTTTKPGSRPGSVGRSLLSELLQAQQQQGHSAWEEDTEIEEGSDGSEAELEEGMNPDAEQTVQARAASSPVSIPLHRR